MALECVDRMYLNAYEPQLTSAGGVAAYFRHHKGHRFASAKQAVETSEAFRKAVFDFADARQIPVHRFAKGERKYDVMQRLLKDFDRERGRGLHRHRPGKGHRAAHHPQALRRRQGLHSVDRLLHGHGQFPLFLLRRRGTEFCTFDLRQSRMATAAGLLVVS
jgi:hypothetical protein